MNAKLSTLHTQRLTDFLSRRLGLDFPESRHADLEVGIRDACRELGFDDPEECIDWLAHATLTRPQVETLASRFTIGETYFFREPEVFEIIERELLPTLVAERRTAGDLRLRLWCAGCASGEEAYTLAIVVTRVLADLQDWHVTILGTDINPQFLKKAAAGLFGEWSFRAIEPAVKARYFEPIGPRLYKIGPDLRRMVHFGYLNLAGESYPSLLTNTAAMDLILCRNVLLYFSPERAAPVTKRFHDSLIDGGWLVGGMAEHFKAPGFAEVSFDGKMLFRKIAEAALAADDSVTWPLKIAAEESLPFVPAAPSRATAGAPSTRPRISAPTAAELARGAANRGLLAEALRYCDEALHAEKLDARLHYLRATILTELGTFGEAEAAFGRTIYLDPAFVLAHFALASLTFRLGRIRESRKHLQHASGLLAGLDRNSVLPCSDGTTARGFESLIQALKAQVG